LATNAQPHLLAVDFPSTDPANPASIPAQVNVGSQLYATCPDNVSTAPCDNTGAYQQLDIDPRTSLQNSLVLPLAEPRSYAADEAPTLTFEGRVFPPRTSGFFQDGADPTQAMLQDPDAAFCDAGVEDSDTIVTEASRLSIPTASQPNWTKKHADYVEITGDFLASTDVYWSVGHGQECGYNACQQEFGNIDNPEVLSVRRDLSILQASTDHLVVTPRCQLADGTVDPGCDPATALKDIRCCFPSGTSYTVRTSHQWLLNAAAGLHDLAAGSDGRCVHTAACDGRKQFWRSRAFEVCDRAGLAAGTCENDDNVGCTVGNTANDVNTDPALPVEPGAAGSQCIFENLTSRFVVYRGTQSSTRGMSFSWQTTGGFTPLSISLATQSTSVNPQSIAYLPELGYIALVDGSSLGLSLFDLNSLAIVSPSPFF
jgi:hypothetical protein